MKFLASGSLGSIHWKLCQAASAGEADDGRWIDFFPESVWAKGSSKSGGLLYIFTSSQTHTFTFSHLLTFTHSHLHILTSSHLYIFSLHIFTSAHPHILTSSHLHILTSSHLHIFTSSHSHIFTSSHPHICASSHILSLSFSLSLSRSSPSRLHIFLPSHAHVFTSSHLLSLSISLSLCLSLSLALSRSLSFFFFSLLRPQAVTTRRHDMATLSHEMRFECQKLRVCCDFTASVATFSHETRFECQKLRVFGCFWRVWLVRRRNEVRVSKTEGFLRVWLVWRQPFRTKWRLNVKNCFFCDFTSSASAFSHEMKFEC